LGVLSPASSESKTRTNNPVLTISDQATGINQQGRGVHLVGSTLVRVGRGGTLNIEDPAGSAALEHVTQSLGALLSGQASLGLNGETNPTTGLKKPDTPADYTKPALTGVFLIGAGLLLILFLKRR
jgi:hypothetical protein